MRWLWALAIASALAGTILLARRASAQREQVRLGPPPPPPPPVTADPRAARTGGLTAKSACEAVYGTNAKLAGAVPDRNAKYVATASTVLGKINCGAVGIAEKAVGAAIVTPAKKIGKVLGKIF